MNDKKYSEKVIRHPAASADGKTYEILERVTYVQEILADGALSEPALFNRRFDLRTGERVNHLGGDDFEIDTAGVCLHITR